MLFPAIAFPQVGPPNARQELAPIVSIGVQDTTKRPQDKKNPAPGSEVPRFPSNAAAKPRNSATPGALGLFDFRDRQFPELTIDVIDSLGKLYPQLKDYLLEQAAILGVLQIDLVERDRKKLLDRAFADLRIPNELESRLRRNQALYGTTENPMKPPPPPYQVNLFDVIIAVSNLLRYIGGK
jgi:hypothetical protein